MQRRSPSLAGMQTDLNGARVLVTGGAGGIGAAITRAFAAEGAHVAVHYHTSRQEAETLAGVVAGYVGTLKISTDIKEIDLRIKFRD